MKIVIILLLISTSAWPIKLKFYDKVHLKHTASFNGHRIGGLSGVFYEKGILYAVSDDRGDYGEPRIHQFKLQVNKKPISLVAHGVILLKDKSNKQFPKGEIDFEGIAKLANGNFYLSSEGDNEKVPRLPPEIFEFNARGELKQRHSFPPKFCPLPYGVAMKGIQNNKAFESLAPGHGGSSLISATEAPIIQDLLSGDNQFLRLITLLPQKGSLFEARESFYPIDINGGFNGLVELIHYDKNRILSLERSWDSKIRKNAVNIFSIDLDFEKLINYKDLISVRNKQVKPLEKKLIYEFDKLIKLKHLKRLDNFEAMAHGPLLPNGNSSLIIISDNNFSLKQRTIILILEVIN